MPVTSGTDDKARVGEVFPKLQRTTTSGQRMTVPDPMGITSTFNTGASPAARSAIFICPRSSRITTRLALAASRRWEVVVFHSAIA